MRTWTVIGVYEDGAGETYADHYPARSALAAMKKALRDHPRMNIIGAIEGAHQLHAPEDYGAAWAGRD